MANDYDSIVIGTGQAGPALAERLGQAGKKVAVIERHLFGDTCVNTGCIPTKTLVAIAKVANMVSRAKEYGVEIKGDVTIDMKKVEARKDEVFGASNKRVEGWLKNMKNVDVYEGHGRFVSNNSVEVNGEILKADNIFINVGGRAFTPPIEGLDEVSFLTNSSIMEVDFVPEHLIVIGGSYIGLEFAQMYRRFGSEITVVEMSDRLISREDEEVCENIKEIMEEEGINVRLSAECITVGKDDKKILAGVDCDNEDKEISGSHLLLATGRVPNTHDLGLENTDIKTNTRGYIEVDDRLQTNVPGVWAIGDCNGRGAFTHNSYNDFEIVASNILDNDPRKVTDRILCYGLFIDPPLGRVAMTEIEAKDSGRKLLVGKRKMTRVGRAREKRETHGFMKVMVDTDTKEILGASILGVEGDEAIHCILDVMYAKAPYTTIQRAAHIHPTVAELIPTVPGILEPIN
ncbi:MAG: FAD-containing oxidoreductase [Candidatus Dadabacteria bacterium]|nr:FAD-containing oxidoreductase [Candidatus Dadabacteria bacterium]NIS09796.1 FAD-containing oxidoreductase [Candidatus Dadabacteria bacterium]NIV41152.1 FAD-containing oxidoreductase [Candidatus Dadabacteria bacterium]NIX16237.1 FAD-containing oxidoreductase [Candidatus Dadabacteria bacterium]NIY22857.1 FAD-containing oxidoreductase [Candidatus Dadabacteria bacterium]